MPCITCGESAGYGYPYCPLCGTKQTSETRSSSIPVDSDKIPSAPKGEDSDTFKPFRAWVAIKSGVPDLSRFADTRLELMSDLWSLLCEDPYLKGWRVICVEVRPVEEA